MKEMFRNRNFCFLFFANLFCGFGQGMTMIGISWYLVESTGSASLLGTTMLISAMLTLLLGPFTGTIIDRVSRKKILQIEQLGGLMVLALLSVWGFWGDYAQWMLVLIYLTATFMFQIHEPTQAAFIQESFDSKHYRAINSLMEMQNQTALVLAGAFAGYLLGPFGLHLVLLLNALTYLIAYLFVTKLDYVFTWKQQVQTITKTSWMEQFLKSWVYIREKRGFLIFGVAALIPFITVTAANLLNPIFVSQTIRADVHIYSLGEVTYSVGAVIAGLLFPFLTRKMGAFSYMVSHYLWMAVAFILTVALPYGWIFVLLSTFLGGCNVSTRLVRQTLYMELLPNQFMGRVMSFFRSVGTLIRLAMLSLFTLLLDSTGAGMGYLSLASLLIMAAIGVALSMPALVTHRIAEKR
ncbi:MFS transporter [Brevibacillus nitrificans]|uniref:MFS transporter n=2 Tax=Brevibacillus nitrificans TaxID=651560 RepID=A0A3M8DJM5_9BACL|nr:MFS transporter [Brevibacillus nitrificans]RNB88253.1 MFS transporter [Brevibacillus nitrificans]